MEVLKMLFTIRVNEINWYVSERSLTVNATYEEVNESNFQWVSDIDCFTMQDTVSSDTELENEVYEFVGNGVLNEIVYTDLQNESDKYYHDTSKIIQGFECLVENRENHILVGYDSILLEEDEHLLTVFGYVEGEKKFFEVSFDNDFNCKIVA
jgi:hypothetical protein